MLMVTDLPVFLDGMDIESIIGQEVTSGCQQLFPGKFMT
jgi:hypothetical protein